MNVGQFLNFNRSLQCHRTIGIRPIIHDVTYIFNVLGDAFNVGHRNVGLSMSLISPAAAIRACSPSLKRPSRRRPAELKRPVERWSPWWRPRLFQRPALRGKTISEMRAMVDVPHLQ